MRRLGYRTFAWLFTGLACASLAAGLFDLVPNTEPAVVWAGLCAIFALCFHELAAAERMRAVECRRRARAGYIIDDPKRRS